MLEHFAAPRSVLAAEVPSVQSTGPLRTCLQRDWSSSVTSANPMNNNEKGTSERIDSVVALTIGCSG